MRITHLRFANLNALVGEWTIDFNDPAFLDDGIFAITGPTGAGKTTILDAICLALYGSTPRLGRITTSQNEIMSRRQGDCFAEVKFDTAKGSYCCHWGQHRSRHQPDGALQAAKHEIADALTGKVIATKLKDVEKQVQTLTGMDFEQFTRSMLLAQGSFAAFLQASPSERSPILEKITGTGIYTEISKAVYLRQKEHKQALEDLKKDLAYTDLMSPEQKQQCESEYAEQVLRSQEQERLQRQREGQLQHYRNAQDLQAQTEVLAAEAKALTAAQQAFLPDAERLSAHQRTEPLREAFQRLQDLRSRHEQTQTQLAELQARLPAAQQAYAVTEAEFEHRKALLRAQEAQWEQDTQIWEQMRTLDTACTNQSEALRQQRQQWEQEHSVYEVLVQDEAQNAAERDTLHEQSQHLQTLLDQSAHHQALIEEMSRFQEWVKNLAQDQAAYQQTHTHLQGVQQQQEAQQRQQAEQVSHQAAEAEAKALSQAHLEQLLTQLKTYPVVSELNRQWEQHSAQMNAVTQSQQGVAQWQEAQRALQNCQEQLQQGTQQAAQAAAQCLHKQAALAQTTQEIHYLQRQWDLEQRIEKLEDYRNKLVAGDPCPLCGSIEHPLGHTEIQPDQTQATLKQLQQVAEQLQSEVHQLTALDSTWQQQADRLEAEAVAFTQKIVTLREGLSPWSSEIQPAMGAEATAEIWTTHLLQVLATLTAAREAITVQLKAREVVEREYQQALEKDQKQTDRLQAQVELSRAQSQALERLNQEVLYDTDQLAQLARRMGEHLRRVKAQWLRCMGTEDGFPELEGSTKGHVDGDDNPALTPQDIGQLQHMLSTLDGHKNRWQARHQEQLQLQQALRLNQQQQASLEQRKLQAEARHGQAEAKMQTLKDAFSALQSERQRRFGDRLAAQEEAQNREQLAQARDSAQAAETAYHEAREGYLKDQQQAEADQKRHQEEQAQLLSLQTAFAQQLEAAGFAHVQDFQGAILSSEVRQALVAQAQQLAAEQTRLETRQHALQQQLTKLQAERLAENAGDHLAPLQNEEQRREMEAVYAEARRELQETLKQQGVLQARLAQDKQAHQQQAQQLKLLHQRQETYVHWKVMYDLIGSSDGKRYRDFAQGLTFDVVLSHANAQLQKMSGRYLLVRASAYDLDLSVMDQQQGGEVRSAQNLSGGESFIVSMALALGLSQMASKNVQVDSLFLDEGFGTLDEDALEVALNTLAELHQENKLIGVISHVPSLKERISTQIKVKPLAGGVSRLEGPGCQRLLRNPALSVSESSSGKS